MSMYEIRKFRIAYFKKQKVLYFESSDGGYDDSWKGGCPHFPLESQQAAWAVRQIPKEGRQLVDFSKENGQVREQIPPRPKVRSRLD